VAVKVSWNLLQTAPRFSVTEWTLQIANELYQRAFIATFEANIYKKTQIIIHYKQADHQENSIMQMTCKVLSLETKHTNDSAWSWPKDIIRKLQVVFLASSKRNGKVFAVVQLQSCYTHFFIQKYILKYSK
jgi:hypothetical protein